MGYITGCKDRTVYSTVGSHHKGVLSFFYIEGPLGLDWTIAYTFDLGLLLWAAHRVAQAID